MKVPNISKFPRSPNVDIVVAGAGVAGLLVSALELKAGRSVHLVEKLSRPGGRLSPENRNGYLLGAGFSFGDSAWWRNLADRLGLKSPTLPVENGGALVHGTRGWTKPEELPAWEAHFSEPCTEFPSRGFYGITESLLEFCAGHENFSFSTESPVTALNCAEAGTVSSVSFGNGSELKPAEVVWCGDYRSLLEVFSGPGVAAPGPERVSWMKKFVKTQPQPGVVLEFAHRGKLGDFTETLLLPFPNVEKEERSYLVGAISSNRDASLAPPGNSLSSWVLPLTEAEWGENHETMKKIRSARRLLEKAFAGFEQSVIFDRVLVLDSTVSPVSRKKGEWHQPLSNLKVAADWAMPNGATVASVAASLLE
jgi:phytoene dehydrogenase-like protein